MDFRTLPDAPLLRLENLTAPACLLGEAGDLASVSLTIDRTAGKIVADAPEAVAVDMGRAMVLPCFTDAHTHIDKGHIWPRAANPDGSFMGALQTVGADRVAHWSAEDVRARADFALRCAFAHGTRALRTHLDSIPPQDGISWPVFRELRADWAGRVELQAVSLVPADFIEPTGDGGAAFAALAKVVAEAGGVLGAVTFPVPDLPARLDRFFAMAEKLGLDADFHVDETMDPTSRTLVDVAEAVIRTGFQGQVNCGHCCSLSTQSEAELAESIEKSARAGLAVISLPMCNMYLQGRHPGRTPRGRGVTAVQELAAAGIPVAFASDNTRDPFYAYGDLDMLEVLREAVRIAHLDHGRPDWARAFTETPAQICGAAPAGLAVGDPADLVLFRARAWSELLSRPQSDRIVLRGGTAIDRTLPDYAELDGLMG
ncbi:cytosine deaminase [Rhodovulum sp. DZ06]|uniref:cytosine deaminase n=1 Tax=Rhodovulum sp. DZ06 TaxID=3425126 RepID=UPI003D330821